MKKRTVFIERMVNVFIIDDGLAFEVVGDTLELHLPYWRSYDYNTYEVVAILAWQKLTVKL